jgi:hypothetical protein
MAWNGFVAGQNPAVLVYPIILRIFVAQVAYIVMWLVCGYDVAGVWL